MDDKIVDYKIGDESYTKRGTGIKYTDQNSVANLAIVLLNLATFQTTLATFSSKST